MRPDLTGQVVEHLDAVTVRVVDVDAVGHAVVDARVDLHTLFHEECDLLLPGLLVGVGDRDMVHRARAAEHSPLLGWLRKLGVLDERDVVVVVLAAVEAHLGAGWQRGVALVDLADLLEAEQVAPEVM